MKLPPLHPVVVHFPIAFCALEFYFLILWQIKKDPAYLRFAKNIFSLTFLSILTAMAAGLYDAGGLRGVHGEVLEHAQAALGFLGVYALRFPLWRLAAKGNSPARFFLLAGSLIALALVAVTGYLGGELVYKHG